MVLPEFRDCASLSPIEDELHIHADLHIQLLVKLMMYIHKASLRLIERGTFSAQLDPYLLSFNIFTQISLNTK